MENVSETSIGVVPLRRGVETAAADLKRLRNGSKERQVHEELWQGIETKLEYAGFHLVKMDRSIQPPERTGYSVALMTSGAIIGPNWQQSFYPHFDAFLSATRSVGQVINCCFGKDTHPALKPRFSKLPVEEQKRRSEFQTQFGPHLEAFEKSLLCTARHISEHRVGYAPVTVATISLLGVKYEGSATKRIPDAEMPRTNEGGPFVQSDPVIVLPMRNNFYIDGKPLFPECHAYLQAAQALIAHGRTIAEQVHGTKELTKRW